MNHLLKVRNIVLFSALFIGLVITAPISATAAYVKEPTIEWQQLIGGNQSEWACAMEPTNDGGIIIAAHTASNATGMMTGVNHGENDIWILKLADAGQIQWQRALGGTDFDGTSVIKPTTDGGYVIVAQTFSSYGGDIKSNSYGEIDFWVVKMNSEGTTQWQRRYGGNRSEWISEVQQTTDGGFILLGGTYSSNSYSVSGTNHGLRDLWVLKLNYRGELQWQRLLGGSENEYPESIRTTSDGGSIILARTESSASGDVTGASSDPYENWIVKLSASGTIQWQQFMNSDVSDSGSSLQPTADGGYILFGSTLSGSKEDINLTPHGGRDLWVAKLSSSLEIQWQRQYGGDRDESAVSLEVTDDGGFVLLGETNSYASGDVSDSPRGAFTDLWAVKLTNIGAIEWEQRFGGGWDEIGCSLKPVGDGEYFLFGHSASERYGNGDIIGTWFGGMDLWLLKLKEVPTITLSAGWNFVSVPAVLAPGADTASIFCSIDTNGHSIFLYNSSSKMWEPMKPSTKVRVLDGIWIYSKTATSVSLSLDSNPLTTPPEKNLAAGWNAIGHSSILPASARDTLLSASSKWSTLIGFNDVSQRYDMSILNGGSGSYADTRLMLPGKGYWLDMREPGRLSALGAGA